jgi:hypothetical protein
VNIKYKVLDWFGPSSGVIALHPILMYYTVEIDSSFFLNVFDVDLPFLFIIGESSHRV